LASSTTSRSLQAGSGTFQLESRTLTYSRCSTALLRYSRYRQARSAWSWLRSPLRGCPRGLAATRCACGSHAQSAGECHQVHDAVGRVQGRGRGLRDGAVRLRVEVADTGPGIAARTRAGCFRNSASSTSGRAYARQGTGLGSPSARRWSSGWAARSPAERARPGLPVLVHRHPRPAAVSSDQRVRASRPCACGGVHQEPACARVCRGAVCAVSACRRSP